ncbi:MAG: histidine phosphatase family protein [Desulfobulbaceae bacterium]|jgi:phosphohistidine phosphatase|nr:histidine phosphatase family protein [Desulfobulbaceae bacterium]
MKTLYLLRHGRAPWSPETPDDFKRILDKTGEHQAASAGARLAREAARPQLILASPADRARQTALIVARTLAYPEAHVRYIPELYAADVWLMARLMAEQSDVLNTLLVVGHNPILPSFCAWLTGEHVDFMPTCGFLAIGFDRDDWSVGRASGRLLWHEPRH